MSKPVSMLRVYVVTPREYEDAVLEALGELGAVHLERSPIQLEEESERSRLLESYARIEERLRRAVESLPPKEVGVDGFKPVENLDQLRSYVKDVGEKVEALLEELESRRSRIRELSEVKKTLEESIRGPTGETVELLEELGLTVGDLGVFHYIFVRAGFIPEASLSTLEDMVKGLNTMVIQGRSEAGRRLVVVTGLLDEKSFVDQVLSKLNFEDISVRKPLEAVIPEGFDKDPSKALEQVSRVVEEEKEALRRLEDEVRKVAARFEAETKHLRSKLFRAAAVERVKRMVIRTSAKTVVRGWIPEDKAGLVEAKVKETTGGAGYVRFEKPRPEDKVPVNFRRRSLLKYFDPLTNIVGTPNYYEIDPTPFFAVLYVAMFGMMFGDIGEGLVFVAIGLALTRMEKELLGFRPRTLKRIGAIIASMGVSAVIFGVLYGEAFLLEVFHPVLLSPIHEMDKMMEIAVYFGVAQIILGLILNVINEFRMRKPVKAVAGGRGIAGLTFYSVGVYMALKFIEAGMDMTVFGREDILPLALVELVLLGVIFLEPTIERLVGGGHGSIMEAVVEGFGEGLEYFISFIANSISYVRLAAFALAHGALGMAAASLAPMVGDITSYIAINIVAITIEGLSAMIQALRLMFYEFSTKFFKGGGVRYEPFIFKF